MSRKTLARIMIAAIAIAGVVSLAMVLALHGASHGDLADINTYYHA